MTNKLKYFIGNWKMFGDFKSFKIIKKINEFSNKSKKSSKKKIVLCVPSTLIYYFNNKLKSKSISLGAQNCHHNENYGSFTGSINAEMIKDTGSKYVILGHSENRASGESDHEVNKKIHSALSKNLKVIFCIGETLKEKRKKITYSILRKQINIGLKSVKNYHNILIAYEPVWSIGTGIIPKSSELTKNINFIRKVLKSKKIIKNIKILYGGSVNPGNVRDLSRIAGINGFIVGGSSINSKNFIDIIKKSIN